MSTVRYTLHPLKDNRRHNAIVKDLEVSADARVLDKIKIDVRLTLILCRNLGYPAPGALAQARKHPLMLGRQVASSMRGLWTAAAPVAG
jgi:hypothetical protein